MRRGVYYDPGSSRGGEGAFEVARLTHGELGQLGRASLPPLCSRPLRIEVHEQCIARQHGEMNCQRCLAGAALLRKETDRRHVG